MNSQAENEQEAKEVAQVEKALFDAIKTKDAKKLDSLLAENFAYRNPMAGEQSKIDFIAAIQSLPLDIMSVWSEDMKVNVFSEAAVITGTQKATVRTTEGDIVTGATAFTDIFVKENGKWVLAIAHGVELQTAPESK